MVLESLPVHTSDNCDFDKAGDPLPLSPPIANLAVVNGVTAPEDDRAGQ